MSNGRLETLICHYEAKASRAEEYYKTTKLAQYSVESYSAREIACYLREARHETQTRRQLCNLRCDLLRVATEAMECLYFGDGAPDTILNKLVQLARKEGMIDDETYRLYTYEEVPHDN